MCVCMYVHVCILTGHVAIEIHISKHEVCENHACAHVRVVPNSSRIEDLETVFKFTRIVFSKYAIGKCHFRNKEKIQISFFSTDISLDLRCSISYIRTYICTCLRICTYIIHIRTYVQFICTRRYVYSMCTCLYCMYMHADVCTVCTLKDILSIYVPVDVQYVHLFVQYVHTVHTDIQCIPCW